MQVLSCVLGVATVEWFVLESIRQTCWLKIPEVFVWIE